MTIKKECDCNTEDDFTCSIHSESDPMYNDKHPFWKTKEGKKLKDDAEIREEIHIPPE
jgi:hypothetical protein